MKNALFPIFSLLVFNSDAMVRETRTMASVINAVVRVSRTTASFFNSTLQLVRITTSDLEANG